MVLTKGIIHSATEITLAPPKTWSFEGNRRDVISCTKGRLWITQEADQNDYVVEAGKDFRVTKPGRVVVQALNDAQFKYSQNKLETSIKDTVQLNNTQSIQSAFIPRIRF